MTSDTCNAAYSADCSEDGWIHEIKFNADGLVPAIAQDKQTGDILMMAWMNSEALKLTAKTKTAVYYSRSRGKLWHKGETSGHTQLVHDIYLDCDADVIVLSVTQLGDIACHTGRRSCFYRKLDTTGDTPIWDTIAPVLKDPKEIYQVSATANKSTQASLSPASQDSTNDLDNTISQIQKPDTLNAGSILAELDTVLMNRKQADADSSYVASLYAKGINKILEKVGEEAIESIIAAKDLATHTTQAEQAKAGNAHLATDQHLTDDLVYEIADVWFHTLVTLAWFNIGSDAVLQELARRFGLSGIDEKNSRILKN